MLRLVLTALVVAPAALASTNVNGTVAAILAASGGVGLAAWSVQGRTGHLCMDGVAGKSVRSEVGGGSPLLLTEDSRYHIGSDTKSMTATLFAILIQGGNIPGGWDATLGDLLPALAPASNPYSNVTLTQLLGMLSGFAPNPPSWWAYQVQHPADLVAQRAACTADALSSTPQATPGSAFVYSNWGYLVAGHVLEVLTGSTWEELVRVRLFAPLGVDLHPDATKWTGAPSSPLGHAGDAQAPCDPVTSSWGCDNPPVLGPAGTFSGPVAATSAYFAWHVRCHNGEDAALLPQEACVKLHTPADKSLSDYGFGWVCTQRGWAGGADGITCTHSGSNTLNMFVVWLGFGIDRAFLAFTNGAGRAAGADAAMIDSAVVALIGAKGSENCTGGRWASGQGENGGGGETADPHSSHAPTPIPTKTPTPAPTSAPTPAPTPDLRPQARGAAIFVGNRCGRLSVSGIAAGLALVVTLAVADII